MTPPPAVTLYLDGAEPVHAIVHAPAPENARDTAVLLCPPFGWDEVASYRARREWARRLAEDGCTAMRISYPGTGNSAGAADDPDRLDAWTEAVAAAARWLRTEGGCRRLVIVGLGLGGLVAYRAIALGTPADELVLWAAPSRGRALVRQLRAFARMEEEEFFAGLPAPEAPPPGQLEAGGFVLTAETVEQLGAVDLAALALTPGSPEHVLVLAQDGIEPEARLLEALRLGGRAVDVLPGDGYGAMVAPPQQSRAPYDTIDRVGEWIGAHASAGVSPIRGVLASASTGVELGVGGGRRVRERPLEIDGPRGRSVATVCGPPDGASTSLCVVLLNAGAIYRIGPNRMWAEAARRWAALGVTTVRLDIESVGDADGAPAPYAADADLYVPELTEQVRAAVDELHRRGVGERFVIGGLCSGAYWSLHVALEHPRAAGAMLVNPRAIVWDPSVDEAGDFRVIRSRTLTWAKIRRNASWSRAWSLLRWLVGAIRRRSAVDDVLERVRTSGVPMLLVFGEDEPLAADLQLSGRMQRLREDPNVDVERVAVRDHTLRPTAAQVQVHAAMDRFVRRAAGADPVDPATAAGDSVRA